MSPENPEDSQLDAQISSMTPVERLTEVLGAVLEPVSEDLALYFAGVDLDGLTPEETTEVKSVFDGFRQDEPDQEGNALYFSAEEGSEIGGKMIIRKMIEHARDMFDDPDFLK